MFLLGLTAFVGSALLAGVVGTALLAKHERGQPVFTFGLFVLVVGFWSATNAGYLLSTTPEWLLRFVQLSYLSVVSISVIWFVFAVQYTDRSDWLSRRRVGLLSVVPAVVLTLVFTAPSHSLFYTSITTVTVDEVLLLETVGGIGHRINILYAYGMLIVGNGLIIGELFTNNRLYRRQSLVLVACLVAPWAANAVFHVGFQPVPTADLTPVVFVLSSLPLAVIVQRAELTGFVPIAHERVFHTLDDPVFVITPSNRILDANRAADELVDATGSVAGRELASVLPGVLLDDGELHPGLATEMECMIDVDGASRQYIARLRATDPTRQDPRGCILSLTDITSQRTRQANLERKNEQLERLASVVSHDLATPLATGESLVHLLRADMVDPPSEVRQSLSDLETVHDRLRTFAEGLPTLARESTDVATPTDCDFETVLRSAWRVVDTEDLRLDVRETCPLTADANRLQQAFENLLQNSVDHGRSAEDDAASTVTAGRLQTTPGFYIEDDGPGIPPERRENIVAFGVGTGTGSGYGLAIVRSTVEAHGWTLSVAESPTGGARFEIRTEPFDRSEQ